MSAGVGQTRIQDALRLHQSGKLAEAEEIYRQILETQPRSPEVLHLLGVLRGQSGDPAGSIELLKRAVEITASDPVLWNNLGEAYRQGARLPEAIAAYRRGLEINPKSSESLRNLSIALRLSGQMDEAMAACRRAIALRPDYAEALNDLGNMVADRKRYAEAITAYRQAIAHSPRFAKAYYNLGIAMANNGQRAEAAEAYRGAVAVDGNYAEAWNNLGYVLRELGKMEEAIAAFGRAMQSRPDMAEIHRNLGLVFFEMGRYEQAIGAYRRALALNPNYPEGLVSLGNAIKSTGRLGEAVDLYRRAIALSGDYADAYTDLGSALKDQGELDEAIAAYRRAMELKPDEPPAHSNLIFGLHYHPDADARTIAEEHARWNAKFGRPGRGGLRAHTNDRNPQRRLRVAYISPDFRDHPVARFLLPVLKNHDHAAFDIVAYSLSPMTDSTTERIRPHMDQWRQMESLSDQQAAEQIRADEIDILVDLAMHTGGNALRAMALKPAPVQFTYLAYCSSTGLETVDYRLSDPYLDPPGEDESGYTERTIRLPNTWWVYEPSELAGEISTAVMAPRGEITFGCLNSFRKVSRPAIAAWARILREVPGSRLLLHSAEGSHRDRLLGRFEEHGVGRERIEFVGFVPMGKYFQLYDRIDVALDPFPYCGGTTTCDALWMGAPVVTLSGRTAVGRAGRSILSNVGLEKFVAQSEDQYVKIAVDLAGNVAERLELRRTMRDRMRNSPLMDGASLARNIEAAYRDAWREWTKSSG